MTVVSSISSTMPGTAPPVAEAALIEAAEALLVAAGAGLLPGENLGFDDPRRDLRLEEAVVMWEACQRNGALLARFGFDVTTLARPGGTLAARRAAPERSGSVAVTWDPDKAAVLVRGVLRPDQMTGLKAAAPAAYWDSQETRWVIPPVQADALVSLVDLPGWEVDSEVRPVVAAAAAKAEADVRASYALEPSRELVIPGLNPARTLRPFQLAGIEYMVDKRRCLNCDPPGVAGKSAQSLAAVAVLEAWPLIIVCKAKLRLNWAKELQMWLPGRSFVVMEGQSHSPVTGFDAVICNFDIAQYRLADLLAVGARALIIDESQYIKGTAVPDAKMQDYLAKTAVYRAAMAEYDEAMAGLQKGDRKPRKPKKPRTPEGSQRTWAVDQLAKAIPEDGAVYELTATPRPNRNEELWAQIVAAGLGRLLGGWGHFGRRYCGLRQQYGKWTSEKSLNKDELRVFLRRFGMVARQRSALAPQLPPLVPLPVEMELDEKLWKAYKKAEDDIVEFLASIAAEVAEESGGNPEMAARAVRRRVTNAKDIVRLTTLRQMGAEAKLASAIDWLKSFVEDNPANDEGRPTKFVVFAHHRKIQEALAGALGDLWIKSSEQPQSVLEVEEIKRRFQEDPAEKFIVIGSGAQEGHTLTAGTDVCLVELPFTWAAVEQVAGRAFGRLNDAHGIGLWMLMSERTTDRHIYPLIVGKGADEHAVIHGGGPAGADSEPSAEGQLLLRLGGMVEG